VEVAKLLKLGESWRTWVSRIVGKPRIEYARSSDRYAESIELWLVGRAYRSKSTCRKSRRSLPLSVPIGTWFQGGSSSDLLLWKQMLARVGSATMWLIQK